MSEPRKIPLGVVGLIFTIAFLAVLLANSLQAQSGVISLHYFPAVAKAGEPVVVTLSITDPDTVSHDYRVTMFVGSSEVLSSVSQVAPSSLQLFQYTRVAPPTGSALRVYGEVKNLDNGVEYSETILIPPSPPELWLSFASFSSFATTFASTASGGQSGARALDYYVSAVGGTSSLVQSAPTLAPINVGILSTIILVCILFFLDMSDPTYGGVGARLSLFRRRYALLASALLLMFLGVVYTWIVVLLSG